MARKAGTRQPAVRPAMDAFVRASKSNAKANAKAIACEGIEKDSIASADIVCRKRKASATCSSGQGKGSLASIFAAGDDAADEDTSRAKRTRRRSGPEVQCEQKPSELLVRPSAPAAKGKRVAKAKESRAHGLSKQTPISKTRQHSRLVQTKLQVVVEPSKRRNKAHQRELHGSARRALWPSRTCRHASLGHGRVAVMGEATGHGR
ncbi:hypothetical protein CDD82_2626 [Ophiocordyceps australis]|uniref:Uncharacterized protein n=1 Tax=Ophiocordyceps australis TaxID=1399860 RepID=A0A2C5X715_9HYPO|nr:hypothetical protein CDD82_2626 [Ophiocordyceps australis]